MAKIQLKELKKLRDETGAGIMDCRHALEESNGNFSEAKKWLIKKGAKLAQEKADRETKSGTIGVYIHNGGLVGAMVKLTCETDFVARTKDFQELAHELAMQVAAMEPTNAKELLEQVYIRDPKLTVADLLKSAVAKIKENIQISEIARLKI